MNKLNREWHEQHIMPKNPTVEERMVWHISHAKNCSCRPIPEKLLAEIKKREVKSRKK